MVFISNSLKHSFVSIGISKLQYFFISHLIFSQIFFSFSLVHSIENLKFSNLSIKYRVFSRKQFLLFDWSGSSFDWKFEAILSFTLWFVYFLVCLVQIRLYSDYNADAWFIPLITQLIEFWMYCTLVIGSKLHCLDVITCLSYDW